MRLANLRGCLKSMDFRLKAFKSSVDSFARKSQLIITNAESFVAKAKNAFASLSLAPALA